MRIDVEHRFTITLIDEENEMDEVMSVQMMIDKVSNNSVEFSIAEKYGDYIPKYMTVIGKNIWYIDSENDFGIVIRDATSIMKVQEVLEENENYDEDECLAYAKAVELICSDILNSDIMKDDIPF